MIYEILMKNRRGSEGDRTVPGRLAHIKLVGGSSPVLQSCPLAMAHQYHWDHDYSWRMEALQLLDRGAHVEMVAHAYGVQPMELLYWYNNREHHKNSFDNFQGSRELERQLYFWYIAMARRQCVTDRMIQWKAMELNYSETGMWGVQPCHNWLKRWKVRYGILSSMTSSRKSQQLPVPSQTNAENKIHRYGNNYQHQSSGETIAQKPSVPQTPMDLSYSVVKDNKSSMFKNAVEEVHSQKGITEQELEDDDEIVKELDSVLSGFQHKIIDGNKESDEDCDKTNRNSDDILEPKPKKLATEEQVAEALLEHRFSEIMKDISPEKILLKDVGAAVEEEKTLDVATEIITDFEEANETEVSSEEDPPTDRERNNSDEEEETCDDIASETNSSASLIESCDEKDEEGLKYVEKGEDDNKNKNQNEGENSFSSETTLLLISISDSEEEVEKDSVCNLNCEFNIKESVCSKTSKSDKTTSVKQSSVLEIDSTSSSGDEDSENDKIAKRENTIVINSPSSHSEESQQIIVLDTSSGEDSDEENNNNKEKVESDDDDVILVENKSETIVIDSDGEAVEEEKGEKSYLEEPHHQHSQFKIILLNTKGGDEDFSLVEPGSLESEPTVVVYNKE